MGSFTKNFRKRVVKTQLKQSKQINLYLMQRVSTLMDEIAELKKFIAPVKREESLERYDNPEVR